MPPLESTTYISGLNTANPVSTDSVSQADDHIRLLKSTLKATFPNITGPVTATQGDLNSPKLPLTGGTLTGPLVLPGSPVADLQAATKAYVDTQDGTKANASVTIAAGTGLTGGGTLQANRTLSIASGGVGTTQLADGAVTQAKLAATLYTGALQQKSTQGFQELPGGFKIMWGTGNSTTDNAQTFSFPTAFSEACYAVITQRTDVGAENVLGVTSKTTSGFTITRDPAINTTVPFNYIAIGY